MGLGFLPVMCFRVSTALGAEVGRLAEHIARCRYCGQRMSDRSDLSDLSDDWHMVQCVPCAVKFQKHMALRQPCANCPLCPLCPSCPFSLLPPCALRYVLRQAYYCRSVIRNSVSPSAGAVIRYSSCTFLPQLSSPPTPLCIRSRCRYQLPSGFRSARWVAAANIAGGYGRIVKQKSFGPEITIRLP